VSHGSTCVGVVTCDTAVKCVRTDRCPCGVIIYHAMCRLCSVMNSYMCPGLMSFAEGFCHLLLHFLSAYRDGVQALPGEDPRP